MNKHLYPIESEEPKKKDAFWDVIAFVFLIIGGAMLVYHLALMGLLV